MNGSDERVLGLPVVVDERVPNPPGFAVVDGPTLAAEATKGFGGFLRCESCGHRMTLGNLREFYATGWPKCCGYTMRWWTQRQIDAGEVPSLAASSGECTEWEQDEETTS